MNYSSYQKQSVPSGQRASEDQSYQGQSVPSGQRASEDQSYQGQRVRAVRSFRITLINLSGRALTRTRIELPHGEFSDNGNAVPPEHVGFPAQVRWESESDGAATGTEGSVTY